MSFLGARSAAAPSGLAPRARSVLPPGFLAVLLAVPACSAGDEPVYTRFNAQSDLLRVQVGVAVTRAAAFVDLHSTTGEVVVGSAEVDPGGGPDGTELVLRVQVDADYSYLVDRASVQVASPGRPGAEYDLLADSADEGLYEIHLLVQAEPGELRTDTLTVALWEQSDTSQGGDTAAR